MTIEKFEKAQKQYYELMDCTWTLQKLKQSYEIVLNICYTDSYASKNSMHKADEEVKPFLYLI